MWSDSTYRLVEIHLVLDQGAHRKHGFPRCNDVLFPVVAPDKVLKNDVPLAQHITIVIGMLYTNGN